MLLGVEGDFRGTPLASLMVSTLTKDQLRLGAAYWWGRALLAHPQEDVSRLSERLGRGKMKWTDLPELPPPEIKKLTEKLAEEGIQKIDNARKSCQPFFLGYRSPELFLAMRFRDEKPKRLYSTVGDWVKKGVAAGMVELCSKDFYKEGWCSEDLTTVWKNLKDFKGGVVAQGLSVPEQTLKALQMGFGGIVLDGWGSVLKGEVDSKRGLIDHCFALSLCAKWPIKILSEPLHLKPEAILASLVIYEQFARRMGVAFENIMFSLFPFEEKERGLIYSLAFVQVLRELFPQSALWTRFSEKMNPFDFFIAALTQQNVVELETTQEFYFKQAQNWLKRVFGLGEELSLNTHSRLGRETHSVLDEGWKCLKQTQHLTLWKALESDLLTTSPASKEKPGAEGVFQKSFHYWNPLQKFLCPESASF